MLTRRRLLWLLPFLGLAPGCKHPPSLVGTWNGTVLQVDAIATFKDDKSVGIEMKEGSMGATVTGTYEVTPKDLNVTISDYKLSSVPDALKDMANNLLKPLKNRELKMHYQFNNDDEVAITYQGKTDVLKRQPAEQ